MAFATREGEPTVGLWPRDGLHGALRCRLYGRRPVACRLLAAARLPQPLQDGGLGVIRQDRQQPIPRGLQHHAGTGAADPFGLAFRGNQPGEEQERDHHDDEAACEPEQEPERAVERAHAAVEHEVGNLDREQRHDQQREQEQAADRDAFGEQVVRDVVAYVGFRARVPVERDARRDQPGRDRQDLAHEPPHHGEDPGDQHDHQKPNIQKG